VSNARVEFIVEEKEFIIAITYQINGRENLNVLCLQALKGRV